MTSARSSRACLAFAALLAVASGPSSVAAQEQGTFDCLIQPMMVIKLGTPMPGLVMEVLVDRGSMVHKGDVVARLQSGVEEASFALAKTRAENEATVRSNRAKLQFQLRK